MLWAGNPDPLLISGSRVAATVVCYSTGIAVTFFVDTESGRMVGTAEPGPSHVKAIAGPGEFLLGFQGYGEFSTSLYDANGVERRRWPSHAQFLIDAEGVISGPESENILPSRSHFVRLESEGGEVQRGPKLSDYYTTYPALDRDGTAVFSRDGALRAVNSDLEMRELMGGQGPTMTSRVLLLEDGLVVAASGDRLIMFRERSLGPLNEGVWPCGDGGLRGNPVKFQ